LPILQPRPEAAPQPDPLAVLDSEDTREVAPNPPAVEVADRDEAAKAGFQPTHVLPPCEEIP
jgi:hypothetical protein